MLTHKQIIRDPFLDNRIPIIKKAIDDKHYKIYSFSIDSKKCSELFICDFLYFYNISFYILNKLSKHHSIAVRNDAKDYLEDYEN